MTWITQSDDDKPILKEIEEQTDRASVLIAVSYLERRLTTAIMARLNKNDSTEKKLFGNSRPLGSFSAKIDLALLLGVYNSELNNILHTIRKIRNDFAHNINPINFDSQSIKALCNNIIIKCDIQMNNQTTNQHFVFKIEPDGTSRTAFLNAIKFFLLLFEMETKQVPLRKPHPPVIDLNNLLRPS